MSKASRASQDLAWQFSTVRIPRTSGTGPALSPLPPHQARQEVVLKKQRYNATVSAEPADMSSNGGLREAWDLGVGEDVGVLGKVSKAAYVGVWC